MSSEDKKFLIRSSGHILGPFYKEEVIDLIKKGKISVFDEVAEPYTIWLYLQDHSDFKKIIHSVSMQTRLVNFLSSVSTKITQISKKTGDLTQDTSVEKTVTETKTKEQSIISPQEIKSASEAHVEEVKPIQTAVPSKSEYISENESEEIIRNKIAFFVKWSWRVTILGVLIVGAYISYKEFYMPIQQKQILKEQFESRGLKFFKAGDFKSALPYFEKAYSNNLINDDEKVLFVSLLLQQNQTSRAGSIKNELSNSPSLKKTKGLLLDSLLSYYQENLTQFKDQTEHLIKNQDKTAVKIALFNLALFFWETKEYKKSMDYLNQLVMRGYNRNIRSYLTALNLLFQKKIDELEVYITDELSFLDLDTNKNFMEEFRQELYLLLAYISLKKQDKQKLSFYITKLLNEDPFLYQDYQYDSFIIKNSLFNWSYFYSYCQEIFNSSPNDNLFKALYGFCYSKANNTKLAFSHIKQAKNSDSQSPLFLSLYGYLIMKDSRDTIELEQIFSEINYKKNTSPLPLILKARFLENQEEWENALSVWKQLLVLEPNHLSGLAGVAFTNYQLGNIAEGSIYAQKAIEQYSHYSKLLFYKK